MVWLAWDGANGLNILMSKNAHCLSFPQNPRTFTSSLALSSKFVVRCGNISPDRGWRCGSISTLGHTSVRSWAVKSLMRFCLIVGNAPLWQLKACVVLN